MKKYKSELSWKIVGPIIAVFVLIIYLVYREEGDVRLLSGGLMGTLIALLFMLYSINYRISDDGILSIRNGIFSYQNIPIDTIHTIEKSNSILSAPAASFNRLEIKYNKYDSVLVSPKNANEFIADLQYHNPKIKMKL